MRDEETGSFWQQVTGRAIAGPMQGASLELASVDEVSLAVFRQEWPQGAVLAPEPAYLSRYARTDWEQRMLKTPTVMDFPGSGLDARELVFGVTVGKASRAYVATRLLRGKVVQDRIGDTPVVLMTGPDGVSVRAFVSRVGEAETQFFLGPDKEWSLLDSATASRWDFRGCAVSGAARGTCLEPVGALKDYWFDWRNYHPDTTVYGR